MPHITSLNKSARYAQWLDVYAERLLPGDYTALFLAHVPNHDYVFDAEEAARIKDKPLVVFDMREYGWLTSWKNHDLLGMWPEPQVEYQGDEWGKLNAWFKERSDHRSGFDLYFKRELSGELLLRAKGYRNIDVHPIDLISRDRPWFEPQSKDEFMARKGGIFSLHGHSHEDRIIMHKTLTERIWPDEFTQNLNVVAYSKIIHHTQRRPLADVLRDQSQFFMSLSLPGAGEKCFRMSESCMGCVPVIADTSMVYAVPFTHENAIMLPTENGRINVSKALDILEPFLLDLESLWPKYQAAQETARMLDQDGFMANIINPRIKEVL